MLKKSEEVKSGNLSFRQQTIESLYSTEEKWDLVFSNAALQWSDNHEKLFPKLISLVNVGGQFAVQLPVQPKNVLTKFLFNKHPKNLFLFN
jgi:trans-aconitate 2-methyltransferase